jgi:hypothetical protein
LALSGCWAASVAGQEAATPPEAARPVAANPPDTRFERLANGCGLYLERVPGCSSIGLFVFVKAGWAQDPAGASGAMRLLGHLAMTGRTPERGGWTLEQWNRERDVAGTVTQSRHTMLYSIGDRRQISSDARRWAEVLGGQLGFGVRELGRERSRTLMEARNETTLYPGPMLQWRARERMLAGTPEGRVGIGRLTELARVSEEELLKLYRRGYHAGNVLLVAVGHVDTERDLPFYRDLFGGLELPKERGLPVVRVEPAEELPPATWKVMQVKAPFATLAFRGPEPGGADFADFVLAALVMVRRANSALPHGKTVGTARFFPGVYRLSENPRLAFVNLRGGDGVELAPVQKILRDWVAETREQAPTEEELTVARLQLRRLLEPLPRPQQRLALLARFPRLLYSTGVYRGLQQLGELPAGMWERVRLAKPEGVHAALRRYFDPAKAEQLALEPKLPDLEKRLREESGK